MEKIEALIAAPLKILRKCYNPGTELYHLLVEHGKAVGRKALEVADKVSHLHPDLKFLVEAAMLHDIGIFLTYLPQIGCWGEKPYVCHGYLGRELLEKEGLPAHALVCERHVGVGITKDEIKERCLPLPLRDMVPVTLEEQIICYADKFFSKNRNAIDREKTVGEIERELSLHGPEKVMRFFQWHRLFS